LPYLPIRITLARNQVTLAPLLVFAAFQEMLQLQRLLAALQHLDLEK